MPNPFFDIVLPFNDTMYWCDNLEKRIQGYIDELDKETKADRQVDPFEVTVKLAGFLARLKHITDDLETLKPHLAVPDDIKHHLK